MKLLFTYLFAFSVSAHALQERPKLVVVWVIDQLRADYLMRFESRFLKPHAGSTVGGFEYLKKEGAYYPYAQYDILNSMTGPGHATILTGAYPYQHGIPLNIWYDHETQKPVYCVEDLNVKTVGPTTAEIPGRSPRNLKATTVSDEYIIAGYPSRVFSIALKDRAAILMGGHQANAAFWVDKKSKGWISSTYYFKDAILPEWVTAFNNQSAKKNGNKILWEANEKPTGLSATQPFVLNDSSNGAAIGLQFPHEVKFGSLGFFYTPDANDWVREFAETAVKANKLGSGPSIDFLYISLSSHDYLGHAFGMSSLEMEEMTVREDRTLSKFLNFLNKEVPGGLKNIVFSVTGDHGGAPSPEWLVKNQQDAGRIDEDETVKKLENHMVEKFGKLKDGQKWVGLGHDFHYFLNPKSAKERDISFSEVLKEAKTILAQYKGVLHVVSQDDISSGHLPAQQHERQIKKTNFKNRSGDVFFIPSPYYVYSGDTSTHITGYNYDRTVPLLISGFGINPGRKPEIIDVVDLAPTLSYLIHGSLPALSEGKILSNAIQLPKK